MYVLKLISEMFRNLKRMIRTTYVLSKCGDYGELIKVNGPTRLTKNTYLGTNIHFNGLVINGKGKVTIGNNFHSGPDCLLITQYHNFNGEALPYDNTYLIKDIEIGDNVWLGSRVIVLGGVKIGEGAIIQAGSCVVRDIPKYSVAGGHPACLLYTSPSPRDS